MAKKPELVIAYTPAGTLAYSWMSKPDEGQTFSDGKYKGTQVFDGGTDMSAIEQAARKAAAAEWGDKVKTLKLPYKDGDDTDKEEFAGKILLTAKSKFQPKFFDSKGQPLPEGDFPKSGDLVRFKIALIPNTAGGGKQVSSRLLAVQLIEKRAGGGGEEDGAGFGVVEGGYVASTSATNAETPKRATATTSAEDDDGDF